MAEASGPFSFYFLEYGDTGWHTFINANFQKINQYFKRLANNVAGDMYISNNAFLIYNKNTDSFVPLEVPPTGESLVVVKDGNIVFTTSLDSDLVFEDSNRGVVLVDRADNTKKYRLYVQNGQLLLEQI